MENHDQFDKNTVLILGHLYGLFPNLGEFDSSKTGDPVGIASTIEFWQRSGFLTVGQTAEGFEGGAHFFFVGLTLPGLLALRSPWNESSAPKTLGQRMIEVADTNEKLRALNSAL